MSQSYNWPPTSWSDFLAWESSFSRINGGKQYFEKYTPHMWGISFAYIFLVFLGKRIMRDREPFKLKGVLIGWNLFLTLFTWLMASRVVPEFYDRVSAKGFHNTICDNSFFETGRAALMVCVFSFSKLPELGDTVFIVLRKKPLILLHWFHHWSVLIYSWYSFTTGSSNGIVFEAMNLIIHSVMYTYYTLAAAGVDLRSISSVLTTAQILQMVVGSAVCVYTLYLKLAGVYCETNIEIAAFGTLMYLCYFVMFSQFFYKRYIKKRSTKKAKKA